MNVLPVRQAERREMRRLAEVAIKAVLGGTMDRRGRRHAARIYGAAAYRNYYNIPGYNHRHRYLTPHPSILGWVCKEFEGKAQSV